MIRVLLWATLLYCVPVLAEDPWGQRECASLSMFAEMIADFRDAGANMKRHLDLFRKRNPTMTPVLKRILERELMRVYVENFPADKAKVSVYTRCMSGQLGGEEG